MKPAFQSGTTINNPVVLITYHLRDYNNACAFTILQQSKLKYLLEYTKSGSKICLISQQVTDVACKGNTL